MRSLTILLFLSFAAPALADDISCKTNEHHIEANFTPSEKAANCASPVPSIVCRIPLEKVNQAANDLKAELDRACRAANQAQSDLVEVSSQADAPQQASVILSRGISGYSAYKALLASSYKQISTALAVNGGPLGSGASLTASQISALSGHDLVKQNIREALTTKEKMMKLPQLGTSRSEITDATNHIDPGLYAGATSSNYLKKIIDEANATDDMIKALTEKKTAADEAQKKLLTHDPDSKKDPKDATVTEKSGGLDMKSIAGLATAGAGLAGLLQKKDSAADAGKDGSATSPTPDSAKSGASSEGPASSKLGSDKAGTQAPVASQTAPKKDSATVGARVPSGSGYSPYSDISKGAGSSFGASSGPPASGKSSGGGGGAGGSFGGTGSPVDPEAAAAAKAANATPEDTQGIGGGSLGGGGPPSMGPGGPGAPAGGDAAAGGPANAEDSMKDLLHEMKETAEGGAPGELQASAADVLMNDEDLFPRVRAAYVRVQKQGRVLDGLAEKITEENQ
jgi:hypothetical protein